MPLTKDERNSHMSIKVYYFAEGYQHRNQDRPGTGCDRSFDSLEEAKAAQFPPGYVFAYIPVDDGYHVNTKSRGWEFHKAGTLPKKLSQQPILDSVFDVRFAQINSASSILPGIFYNKLDGEKAIEQLPAATLPKQIRDNDPNLKYAPIIKITCGNFMLLISDYSVSIAPKMPYPGWSSFKENILKVVDILNGVFPTQIIQRYALKYVDLIPYKDLRDQIAAVDLNIKLGTHCLDNQIFQFRIEIKKDEYINIIQILSSAVATLPDLKTKKEGLVIDIDTICDVNIRSTDFVIDLQDKLEKIHDMNKHTFFSCLTQATLIDLGPTYE